LHPLVCYRKHFITYLGIRTCKITSSKLN
jgi:hypothetical protein